MTGPQCAATTNTELPKSTHLGSRIARCPACRRPCHERTGTPDKYLAFPTDSVVLVVRWRRRYLLRLRDVAKLILRRGFAFPHETVRAWETRFAPLLADARRRKRKGKAGRSWSMDETYGTSAGSWCSLSRAVDRDGNRVDVRLREQRDMDRATRFCEPAVETVGHTPDRVTTDGHDAFWHCCTSRRYCCTYEATPQLLPMREKRS